MAMEITCRISDAHSLPLLSVAFNRDRNEIYTGSQDALIKVWDIDTGKQLRVQKGHQTWVTDLLYNTAACILFSCSIDGNIIAWSDKGKLLQVVEFGSSVYCMAWDSKGKHLVAGGKEVVQLLRVVRSSSNVYIKSDCQSQKLGSVKFLQPRTVLFTHRDVVQAICCSEQGNIFTTGFDKCICMFESGKPGGAILKITDSHEGAISAAAYDRDAKSLVTGSYDGTVKIWSHEGHCLDTFNNITDCVTSIAYIPFTRCYWVTGKSRLPVIIDAVGPADVTNCVGGTCLIDKLPLCKVFHAPNRDVAIGLSYEREIIVWRYNRFGPHRILQGHEDWIEAILIAQRKPSKELLFARDTKNSQKQVINAKPGTSNHSVRFSAGSNEQTVDIKKSVVTFSVDESPDSVAKGLVPHGSRPQGQSFINRKESRKSESVGSAGSNEHVDNSVECSLSSLQEIEIYSAGSAGTIMKWQKSRNCDSWASSELVPPSHHTILCILYHTELDVLITGSEDSKIRLWNLDGLPNVAQWKLADGSYHGPDYLKGHIDRVTGIAACRNEVLVSASYDKSLRWWSLTLQLPIDAIDLAHDCSIEDLAYSTERDELASCAGESRFKVWDATKRKFLHAAIGKSGDLMLIRWCGLNGGFWLTTSYDGTITSWDPNTLCELRSIPGRNDPITTILLDEINDIILVSMLSDYSIRAYSLELAGDELFAYSGHTDQVHSMVYLKSRNQYLSASWDKTIRAWLLPNDDQQNPDDPFRPKGTLCNESVSTDSNFSEEEVYISNYERNHPLIIPKQLQEDAVATYSKRLIKRQGETAETVPASDRQNDSSRKPSLVKKLDNLEKTFKDMIP